MGKYTSWLIVSTFIASLSSFNFGYNISVLSNPQNLINKWLHDKIYGDKNLTMNDDTGKWEVEGDAGAAAADVWNMTFIWSVLVSSYTLFGMVGAFTTGFVADKLGRKRGIMVNHIMMFVGAFLEWGCKPFDYGPILIVGRSFIGFNCGLSTGIVSLYLTEIAPISIRGAIGACHQMQCVLGILTAQVLGLPFLLGGEYEWHWLLGMSAVPALVSAVVFPFCPESPRYLLMNKNNTVACKDALKKLLGKEDVNEEMAEMENEKAGGGDISQPKEEFKLAHFYTKTDLRLPLLIAIILQVTQQWSGINAVMMYSGDVFKSAKVDKSQIPYWTCGVGVVNVLATIVALPLIEKLGRRKLLLLPLFVMGASMSLITMFTELEISTGNSIYSSFCAFLIFIYVIGFAVGCGPIPAMIVAELFRQGPRPSAMTIAQVTNWVCNLILVFCFSFVNNAIGHFTFLIFTGVIILCGLFIFFFVPETRNRTFDEIARDLARGRRRTAAEADAANGEMLQLNVDEPAADDEAVGDGSGNAVKA